MVNFDTDWVSCFHAPNEIVRDFFASNRGNKFFAGKDFCAIFWRLLCGFIMLCNIRA